MARVFTIVDDGYISGFSAEVAIFFASSDLLPAGKRSFASIRLYLLYLVMYCIRIYVVVITVCLNYTQQEPLFGS